MLVLFNAPEIEAGASFESSLLFAVCNVPEIEMGASLESPPLLVFCNVPETIEIGNSLESPALLAFCNVLEIQIRPRMGIERQIWSISWGYGDMVIDSDTFPKMDLYMFLETVFCYSDQEQ